MNDKPKRPGGITIGNIRMVNCHGDICGVQINGPSPVSVESVGMTNSSNGARAIEINQWPTAPKRRVGGFAGGVASAVSAAAIAKALGFT